MLIFSGGNDDGFSIGSYAQADNINWVIFAGGNNDGFGYASVGSIGNEVPLPIELLNFIAYVQNNWIALEWQTASETNNDFFTLERTKDTEVWTEVIKVKGAGNSSKKLAYKTFDYSPFLGISYYRLKQTDFDGQYAYSKVVTIKFDKLEEQNVLIYPNPATNEITLKGDPTEIERFKIYNIHGQDAGSFTHTISAGRIKIIIDISKLPKGLYTLKTRTGIRKIVKR